MDRRRAPWGILMLCAALAGSAAARAEDDEATARGWRLKGDRGETVKVFPPPAAVPGAAGHPVFAPITGMTVYPASYGSGNLVDHGGLEIGGASFYQLYYDRSIDSGISTGIDSFITLFGGGIPDYTIIQQYGSRVPIAAGLTNAGVHLDQKGAPRKISDSQVQSYLAALFNDTNSGVAASASTIYGVYLPNGTTSTLGRYRSCTNYCGYHSVFTHNGVQIKYAVFPYPGCSGCSLSGLQPLDMWTIVTSHEIREAVTDPGDNGNNAWYDRTGYEADDKCAWHHLYQLSNLYWVQPEYSNANGGCVVNP
jgi:hypothetical protein